MVLIGYAWSDIIVGILWVSLAVLILVIAYKLLLRFLNRGAVNRADFCELYSLEIEPASGILPFYFTSDKVKNYRLLILDNDMKEILEIENKECKIGGNIIRFDSNQLKNGSYFYCLKTENQKVLKKMQVKNGSAANKS